MLVGSSQSVNMDLSSDLNEAWVDAFNCVEYVQMDEKKKK